LDVEILGMKRVEQCVDRWKKAYEKDGIVGLVDSRKEAVLRPSKRVLSQEEIIARQEAKIRLLEEQLAHVKKVRQERKEAVSKRRKTEQD
jgi:putative transposase